MAEAMRTAKGVPVFAREDGTYTTQFPEEYIVRNADGDDVKYKVYGFVGDHDDYEGQEFIRDKEDEAIEFATEIYGSKDVDGFSRTGEVFEVEVHEIDAEDA